MTTAAFGGLSGSGAFNLQNSTASALTLTLGATNLSSTFAGSMGGAGGIIKAGTGTLTLNGTSSFSGGVALTAGVVEAGAANALGASGSITFSGNAMLRYLASDSTDYGSRIQNSTTAINIDTSAAPAVPAWSSAMPAASATPIPPA